MAFLKHFVLFVFSPNKCHLFLKFIPLFLEIVTFFVKRTQNFITHTEKFGALELMIGI
jgi:hypothetical protein